MSIAALVSTMSVQTYVSGAALYQVRTCRALCRKGSITQNGGVICKRYNKVEAYMLMIRCRLPERVSYDEGALLEPLSVAIHTARKCRITKNSTCLILGAGAVGLLCAAVVKLQGCKMVVMTDIVADRLAFAKENGFADEILINEPLKGVDIEDNLANSKALADALIKLGHTTSNTVPGYDHVIECTGVEACVRTSIYVSRRGNLVALLLTCWALQACRPSGDVLLVGMGTPIQNLPMSVIGSKEIKLTGIWRYADTYPEALEIMAGMQADTTLPDIRKLLTHQFSGLDKAPDAFATAARTQDESGRLIIKVVVRNGH